MAERNLPTAQSQAGGLTPVVRRRDTSNAAVDILQGAASLVNTFQRASAAEASAAAATQAASDDVTIGNMLADRNQLDLDRAMGAEATSSLQESARAVARAEEDGLITPDEEIIVKQYLKSVASLDLMKAQNPTAFSTQKASIQKKIAFQQVLRENPRLGTKLTAARNSLNAGPDAVSGAQVEKAMLAEKRIKSVYGDSPNARQRIEFAELSIINDNNKEMTRRNDIKAKAGELTLTNIMQAATANLDLAIVTTSTKFNTELQAGGGFARTQNVEPIIETLNTLKTEMINNIYLSVADQNSGGKAIIDRASVAKQVAAVEKQISDTVILYKEGSTLGLMKEISEYQTNWLKINGGNVASSAKTLMGIRGDNMGSMLAMSQLMNGTTAEAAVGIENLRTESGMEGFTASKEQFMGQLAIMMAEGVPIPKNLQKAAIAHGILAARAGPIDTNTQKTLLDGATTLGTTSIPDAVKVLLDPALGRQLGGAELVGTVRGMDTQVSNDVRMSGRSVTYDPSADKLRVFGTLGREQVVGNEFIPRTVIRSDEERLVTDIDLTNSLNALYDLRRNGDYVEDLEAPADFVKTWTERFAFEGFAEPVVSEEVVVEESVTKPVTIRTPATL
mgnify:CR=1 FL=1|tara:strand:+ start:18209 stop:20068 length:1860 start_codon:yes stop_codon:yes gene_type:complete